MLAIAAALGAGAEGRRVHMRSLVMLCFIASVCDGYSINSGLVKSPALGARVVSPGGSLSEATSALWLSSPGAAVPSLDVVERPRRRNPGPRLALWLGRAASRSATPVASAVSLPSFEIVVHTVARVFTIALLAAGILKAVWRWVAETITESPSYR